MTTRTVLTIITWSVGLAISGACVHLARGTGPQAPERRWLAGDHHVHSQYSVGWNDSTTPPTPIIAGDAANPIPRNAAMAKQFGLSWMVSTDHGGPNHSKINLEQAYPELLRARREVSGLILFFGMELDTPGADHSSLIMPHSEHEHTHLHEIERRFSKRDSFPRDTSRDTVTKMVAALRHMDSLAAKPVLIANHPARSATGAGQWGQDTPSEFRAWNDAAPKVAIGMEGAPGHQAGAINEDGSIDSTGIRGGYRNHATMGGFDQMTATLGGLWDSMLGEGRRWWITASSDAHRNWREGGSDFWPGEYAKTYVHAARSHADILDGVRNGRVFVTTGDLIDQLAITATSDDGRRAALGEVLPVRAGRTVQVTIRVRDPDLPNHHGDTPQLSRVDLITGMISGPSVDRAADRNASAKVVRRFTSADWTKDGEFLVMTHTLRDVHHAMYLRVRGTNGTELEPSLDPRGENPWSDLWFYANPIFLSIR